ncbi:uncharacterized protein LOC135847827 [Planococcus citri]|uniref:uncharacterized protein LOC135847827 n=1 Tax=Planococcus citri TaxID=170843 RepID=UPI0031F86B7F
MNTKREAPESDDEPLNKRRKIDVDEVCEKIPICCTPAPLKQLSAMIVSLAIWCHYKIRSCKDRGYAAINYDVRMVTYDGESFIQVPPYRAAADYENDDQPVMKPIRDSIETLSLPTPLANIVLYQCKIRERELRLWAFRHKRLISLESFSSEDIFWNTNGYIDYLKTVRNVLSSSKLDTLEKFELMSEYCLKDDIESLPMWILYLEYVKKWTFYQNPKQVYWRCCLQGNLHTIESWLAYNSQYASLDTRMLLYWGVSHNQSSLEYFFNKLSDADRVSASISLIYRVDFRFKTVLVLSKLNEFEYDQVLKSCAYLIIMDLGRFVEYENYVSNLWINYKEQMSEYNFIEIILSLFRCPKVDQDAQDHVDRLLFDIWDTSIDAMKEYLLEKRSAAFLITESRRFEFLKKIFIETSTQKRNEIVKYPEFLVFCTSLIETHHWFDCDSFIKLFFPNDNKVLEFKENLLHNVEIVTYCRKLFLEHGVERLHDLLTKFLPNSGSVLKYKTEYLLYSSVFLRDYCILELKSNGIEKVVELIDYKFPDSQKAADFCIKLMSQSKVVKMMCQFINEGKFDKTRNMIDHLLVRTEDVDSVKRKLLSEYKNSLKMGKCLHLRKVEWDEFLSWCSDSAKEQLKNSLKVDDIFSKMLNRVVPFAKKKDFEIESRLEDIDYFLSWYFETKDRVDEYKLEKVHEYRDIFMKKINTQKLRGLCLRKLVVGWFFNRNQILIDDFYE